MLALALSVAGLIGVGFTLLPPRLGNADWEVATFGQLAASMALPGIGLALLGGLAAQARSRWGLVLVSVACALLAVVVSLGALVVTLDVPLVRAAAINAGSGGTQLKVLTFKTIGLSGIHGLALWFMAVYFARVSIGLRRKS